MSTIAATISSTAAALLRFSPTAYIKSWLLYLGIQTHVRGTIDPELKPLHNVCEYLNALHIYADEARQGRTRSVEAFHFCSHVSKDFRQCLIYDSNSTAARLIGVEYMIPKSRYLQLPADEKRLWHSHEFEVTSGMLILPAPPSHQRQGGHASWESLETEAMKEVIGWYGKTYHFWEVDLGHDVPFGAPKLMGSLTAREQVDEASDQLIKSRDRTFNVDSTAKSELRASAGIRGPGIADGADSWWAEAKGTKSGIYQDS